MAVVGYVLDGNLFCTRCSKDLERMGRDMTPIHHDEVDDKDQCRRCGHTLSR